MPIDFPTSPTLGQSYVYGGVNYTFTAQGVWIASSFGQVSASSAVTMQRFIASGTYTPTPGTMFAIVECIGGGGGGGGANPGAGVYYGGGGGGSGGYSRTRLTAAQIGASKAITIGAGGAGGIGSTGPEDGTAGGTTSLTTLCVANGGAGGKVSSVTGAGYGHGGDGATTTGAIGDVTFAGACGQAGYFGQVNGQILTPPGAGAPSAFGGGGTGGDVAGGAGGNGVAASNYGAGGGGALAGAAGPKNGGAGSAGIVIITEYNIAASGPVGPTGAAGGANNLHNGKIVETRASNIATFAVKTLAGADPSAGSPVTVAMYDGTTLTLTAALSFSTSTATLGVGNASTPFRLWFAIASAAGTPRLLARLCTYGSNVSGAISGFDARGVTSAVVVANTAHTTYAAVALSNVPYKIVAFADYETGLATPGIWNAAPTRIVQAGAMTPLPGSVVQVRRAGPFAQTPNGTAAFVNTNTAIGAAASSPMNPFIIRAISNVYITNGGTAYSIIINRDAFAVSSDEHQIIAGTGGTDFPFALEMMDFPLSTATKSWFVAIKSMGGTIYVPGNVSAGYMTLTELMA